MKFIKARGFSLVEMLVTIAIVVLLMIVSIPQFRNYRSKTDLKSSAEIIQAKIYDARNLAMAPEIDKPESIAYYAVMISNDGIKTYEKENISAVGNNDVLVDEYVFEDKPFAFKDNPNYILFFSIDKIGKIEAVTGRYGQEISNEMIINLDLISSKIDNYEMNISLNTITGQITINE